MTPPPPESPPPPEGAGGEAALTPRERLEMRMLRARIVRDVAQVVALTAAAAWAISTFWYQRIYVPKYEQPNVVLGTSLEIVADRDGFVVLKANVRAHNPGRASVRLISESISLVGSRFSAPRGAPLGQADLPAGGTNWAVGSGVEPEGAALLASHVDTAALPSTHALEPNETIERVEIFRVPKTDYDTVAVIYYAVFNNLNQPPPPPENLSRHLDPDGVVIVPALPKGLRGSPGYTSTSSRAGVVLPR